MAEEFKILSPREHCRRRPQMYVGSTSIENIERFVLGQWKSVRYVPSIFKMINEIIDNSVDEFMRSGGKNATKIDVTMEGNVVTITDNGRGIPQDKILTPEGEYVDRAVAAWTMSNAGTSFGDNRTTIGSHGLGSALVNYMSTDFKGETWRDGECIAVTSKDGANEVSVDRKPKRGSGTSVMFAPDFSLVEVDDLSEIPDLIALVEDRIISLQLAFPEITFSINKKKVDVTDIKKYAELFAKDGASVIIEKSENLSYFFAASEDGFRTNSFVNGVNTFMGGTYVDFVVNGVVEELVGMIKKKHKVEVTKSTIKNGLSFVLFARNFTNPKFDSQTKERLTNSMGQVKEHYEASGCKDVKLIAKKVFAATDIIEPLIAAQIAKREADQRRDALVAQKKLKKVKVAKHIAAMGNDGRLLLVEGDCIEENTMIHVLGGDKPIKDVVEGDYVFTHKHRYREVRSNAFALKEGVKINGTIYSKEHRLFVYDTAERKFGIKKVCDIVMGVDKLIKHRYITHLPAFPEVVVRVDAGRVVTTGDDMLFSDSHDILVFNEDDMCIETKKWFELKVGMTILL